MTRAMNSDRAKGSTALCGKPAVLPFSCLRQPPVPLPLPHSPPFSFRRVPRSTHLLTWLSLRLSSPSLPPPLPPPHPLSVRALDLRSFNNIFPRLVFGRDNLERDAAKRSRSASYVRGYMREEPSSFGSMVSHASLTIGDPSDWLVQSLSAVFPKHNRQHPLRRNHFSGLMSETLRDEQRCDRAALVRRTSIAPLEISLRGKINVRVFIARDADRYAARHAFTHLSLLREHARAVSRCA